jgi:hypothetical protein
VPELFPFAGLRMISIAERLYSIDLLSDHASPNVMGRSVTSRIFRLPSGI